MVKAQPGQSSDQVIRAFQKKVLNEDILGELKKREYYQKPATIKKNKAMARKHPNRRTY
ncbi:MAG: 30S ribosomal protein S21 [Patescibacteria group bacterium]|nr:30S ribosomal protein S21 [Patescibacteria group bacterium]MCL5432177.1 30S ribosomal protein S21 [Patescibacteria group bacterium]